MKTFRLLGITLFALAICLGFSSCSSDDDEIGDVSNIIGTWQITHSTGWYINDDGEKETWDDDESDYRWVFYENGNVKEYYYVNYSDSWRQNMAYNYTIEGNKLYLGDYVYTIKRLNDTTMILVDNSDSDYYEVETFMRVDE